MIGGSLVNLALFAHQLKSMEDKLRAAAQARAEEEAQRAVEAMQAQIPEDSGTARESIRWEPLPNQGGARVMAGGPETTKDGYDYVKAIEWGRPPSNSGPGQAAHPFFRPVQDETNGKGLERMAQGIASDMKD